ncbi:MAG: hypothetical protein ACJ780_03485 [Solirubrobacteraceae bacterium]
MSTEHDPPTGSPVEPESNPGVAGEGAGTAPGRDPDLADAAGGRPDSHNMLPPRERRRLGAERLLVRVIATCGIVAIGVAIAAIMVSSHSQGWLVGLVVSVVSVVLAAILWSSRQL